MQCNYFKNLDIFRFVFAILIVILHIIHIAAEPLHVYKESEIFRANSLNINYVVELFFIMSGFLFYIKIDKNKSLLDFIKSKIIRLSPVLLFTIFLFGILSLFGVVKFWTMDNIFALFFLNGVCIANHPSPWGGVK